MSESIFTKIIKREVPSHVVYEDDDCIAILDTSPAVVGQSLVIPKKEIAYAFDLDDDTYIHLFKIAKKIGKASDKAFNAERTCLVVEGLDVPHVHIKIYPMQDTKRALGELMAMGKEEDEETLAAAATQLIAAIDDLDEKQ